jgi:Domain of unknown function (DUF397)
MLPGQPIIGQQWRKSTRSMSNGECIEVGLADGDIAVRDSKAPAGSVLLYRVPQWRDFLAAAKSSTPLPGH